MGQMSDTYPTLDDGNAEVGHDWDMGSIRQGQEWRRPNTGI